MPFDEPFNSYYDLILKPAVEESNLEPLRGDSLFKPSPIMGDIWEMIQDSKVLLAEFTGKNPNVFYELGLAHAIGKPVVLISETMSDVPFDLQALRVVLYDKDDPAWGDKLRQSIKSSLEETLEDTARAVPPMFRKRVESQAPEATDVSLRLFDLERRVASLSTRDSLGISKNDVDWTDVKRHVDNPQNDDELFDSRAHAVAVTVLRLRDKQSRTEIRDRLNQQLSKDEATKVYELATVYRSMFD